MQNVNSMDVSTMKNNYDALRLRSAKWSFMTNKNTMVCKGLCCMTMI